MIRIRSNIILLLLSFYLQTQYLLSVLLFIFNFICLLINLVNQMFRRPSAQVEQPDAGLSLEEMEIEQQILKVLTITII